MWAFCLHSLFREYGWRFVRRVALPHPFRTARAVFDSGRLDVSGGATDTSRVAAGGRDSGDGRSIVGVGFCLKPLDPPCPSGRANHGCLYLERLLQNDRRDVPAPCRECAIREIGTAALASGAAFYIMTSARDILYDVFVPALDQRRFSSGLFVLCRYSLRPFAAGLLASGIRGRLFTFERGDCRDYKTWLKADRGIKEERTVIETSNNDEVLGMLKGTTDHPMTVNHIERRGNIFHPQLAIPCDKGDLRERANGNPRK